MWRKVIFLMLLLTYCPSISTDKRVNGPTSVVESQEKQIEQNQQFGTASNFRVTSYKHDYGTETSPRQNLRQRLKAKASVTTTERPLIHYLNNFLNNVRIPVPNITWNLTNPLANFFNDGNVNIIETPPVVDYNTNSSSNNRKRTQQTRKRKNNTSSINKKHKPRIRTQQRYDDEETIGENEKTYDDEEELEQYYVQQPLFFYDPNTGNYYGVHRLTVPNYHDQANLYDYLYSKKQELQRDSEAKDANVHELRDENMEVFTENNSKEDTMQDIVMSNYNENKNTNSNAVATTANETDLLRNLLLSYKNGKTNSKENTKSIQTLETLAITDEQLRNILISYHRDDRLNRQRQRTSTRESIKVQSGKQQPRQKYKYYFLRAW